MKTNHPKFFCLSLFLILSPLACLDEIDLPLPDNFQDALVIQGSLVKGTPSTARVSINKMETKDRAVKIEYIPVASVSLINESGQELEMEDYDVGRYEVTIPDGSEFLVEYGKKYKTKVITFDGDIYESSLEELFPVPQMDSLKVEAFQRFRFIERFARTDTFDFLRFTIDTPLEIPGQPGDKSFLHHDFFEAYEVFCPFELEPCYVERPLTEQVAPVVAGPILYNADYLNDHNILETWGNFRFAFGYYLTVIQQSISERTFEYFDQINQVKERTGSPFQPAPGNVKTNITNLTNPEKDAQGYFYATEHDTLRIYVDPVLAKEPELSDLPCTVQYNCVPEKPGYWE